MGKRITGLLMGVLFVFASYQNCAPSDQGSFSSQNSPQTTTPNACWDCYPALPPNTGQKVCVHEFFYGRNSTSAAGPFRDFIPTDPRLIEPVFSPFLNQGQVRLSFSTNFRLEPHMKILEHWRDLPLHGTQINLSELPSRDFSDSMWPMWTQSNNSSQGSTRVLTWQLPVRNPDGSLWNYSGIRVRAYSVLDTSTGQILCRTNPTAVRFMPTCGLSLTQTNQNACYVGSQAQTGIELRVERSFSTQGVSASYALRWFRTARSETYNTYTTTASPVSPSPELLPNGNYRISHSMGGNNVLGGTFRLWFEFINVTTGEILCRSDFVEYTVAQSC